MRHENSEVLRVKKYLEKILELVCAEKTSLTSNKNDISQIYKYCKEKENAKDQLQSRIDSHSKNIEIT